ncbi:MAG: SPOR domain-containing protein [Thermoanaerobaculia bacterium]
MWKYRNRFEHLHGVSLISVLMMMSCSSAAPPPSVEEELVRPAEPLPVASSEIPPAAEAPAAAAPEATEAAARVNQIHSIELLSAGPEAVLEVVASRPMVWLSQREGERRLVIELPGTFPGPEVEEIATFEGLVAAVLFEADPSEPRTRIIVLTRGPALTSLVPRGDRLRIKLSPAETETDREAVAETPPAQEPETAAPAVQPTSGEATAESIYELQLGLFSVKENATGLVADLKQRGYPAYVVEVTNSTGRVFHTVRLGPYATRQEARGAAAEYHDREGGETLIRWRPRPPADQR